jgi:hypothetical protein
MSDNRTLTADQRVSLRKAISSHPDWKQKRDEYGWKIDGMTVVTLLECADILAIDVEAIRSGSASSAQASSAQASSQAAVPAVSAVPAAVTPAIATAAASGDPLALLREMLLGSALSPERIGAIVDERVAHAMRGVPTVRIEAVGPDKTPRMVEGHQHPAFKRLMLSCVARKANKDPLNVWISGPAGSGKTFSCKMVAKALGLNFYLHSAVTATFEVMGWKDAGGAYHRTQFREAYEHGGVIVLDEVDSYDPNATMALNSPLENGFCVFPDKAVERHPDCIIIATANTWGLGANSDYVGRNKLDGAFRDRFGARIQWDYDVALELAISGNEAWTRRVQGARERARAAGLKVLITPRASQSGAALIAAGASPDEAAEMTYLADLTKEQRRMVEG